MRKNHKLLKNQEFIHAMICLIFLILTVAVLMLLTDTDLSENASLKEKLVDIFDVEMFASVVAAFLLNSVASLITRYFTDACEDDTKLTSDYDGLVKKYEANTQMLSWQNSLRADHRLGRKKTACKAEKTPQGDRYRLPVGDVLRLRGRKFEIHDDPDKRYTPPVFSGEHYSELINAHNASNTFNQINLRLDDIYEREGTVHAHVSRTTYFDSLVTNRAIDYKIGGLSVRDLYACGPFLPPLDRSELSNHLGFNGMVETADGQFIFIKRHKRVSIGKNTMQCSVAASLKAKRALDASGRLTVEKIGSAVVEEITDELNLKNLEDFRQKKQEIFREFSFEKSILYFYRDLVEGGKPQLMFYTKLALTADQVRQAYTKGVRGRKKNPRMDKLYCSVDGYKILFVPREELDQIYLSPDGMVIYGRHYPATPSAVGTVIMLLRAMEQGLV